MLDRKTQDTEDVRISFMATDESLKKLTNRSSITALNLSESAVSDKALKELATLPKLRSLRLSRTNVRTLEGLENLTKLVTLELKNTPINDQSLLHVRPLKNLLVLTLSATNITDSGITHLAGMPNLRELDLTSTLVTSAVSGALAKMPLVNVTVDKTSLDEAAIRKIAAIRSLEYLGIEKCEKISKATKERLYNDFPTIHFSPRSSKYFKRMEHAYALKARKDFNGALKHMCESATMLEKRHGMDYPELFRAYITIGTTASDAGQSEQASKYFHSALQLAERQKMPSNMLIANDHLTILYSKSDRDKSEMYCKRALRVAETIPRSPAEIATRSYAIANYYATKGKWKEAAFLYRKSIPITERTHQERVLGVVLLRFANCLRESGQPKAARKNYEKGIEIMRKYQLTGVEKGEVAMALTGLAAMDLIENNNLEALKHSDESTEYYLQSNDPNIFHMYHLQRSLIFTLLGRKKDAQSEQIAASKYQSQKAHIISR
ncbi:MAG: hypothetical protein SGJ27_10960 [Candidatus Melainabacteria bacterium]|nr:hypothetical protein [Candidatus Melainabacteria bacterium]